MDCIFQSLSVAPEGLTVGQMAGIGAGVGAAGIVALGGISTGIYIYKSKMIGIINRNCYLGIITSVLTRCF